MLPCNFDESTGHLDAPPGSTNVSPLFVHRSGGVVVSCWKPTKDELAEISRTGRVWLTVCGDTMPPVHIQGSHPFVDCAPKEGE